MSKNSIFFLFILFIYSFFMLILSSLEIFDLRIETDD